MTAPREVTANPDSSTVACPVCGSVAGLECFFDAFERLGADGVMRDRRGDFHRARISAAINARAKAGR